MALLPSLTATPKAKAKASRIIICNKENESTIKKAKPPTMEEMMMVMMKIRTHEAASPNNHNSLVNIPVTTSACPTWKLYENPFYISHHKPSQNHQLLDQEQEYCGDQRQIHRLHLPISARKIAASFWDLTFIKPFMESVLELARAQINELKADLECERKARKKMENLNKRLARELSEERKGREELEKVCQELAKEISSDKAQISRMSRDMEEERKMLRTAEVIREERVQMKLAEAKMLLEEKLSELEIAKKMGAGAESSLSSSSSSSLSFRKEKSSVVNANSMALMQRKVSPEAENPHIKRGIKGFVEFPKVIRAIGCRSSKHSGSKLECQKAQLKTLLKQKGPVRFNGLIAS